MFLRNEIHTKADVLLGTDDSQLTMGCVTNSTQERIFVALATFTHQKRGKNASLIPNRAQPLF